jgi:hypothetical protein
VAIALPRAAETLFAKRLCLPAWQATDALPCLVSLPLQQALRKLVLLARTLVCSFQPQRHLPNSDYVCSTGHTGIVVLLLMHVYCCEVVISIDRASLVPAFCCECCGGRLFLSFDACCQASYAPVEPVATQHTWANTACMLHFKSLLVQRC